MPTTTTTPAPTALGLDAVSGLIVWSSAPVPLLDAELDVRDEDDREADQ